MYWIELTTDETVEKKRPVYVNIQQRNDPKMKHMMGEWGKTEQKVSKFQKKKEGERYHANISQEKVRMARLALDEVDLRLKSIISDKDDIT